MMAQMRLDKLLASTGRWSRREVKRLVKDGLVLVDGKTAASAEEKRDPEHAVIRVNGEEICFREHYYIMLHKPAGLLSATEDRHTPTVLDLLPPELQKRELFPVGRLDKDTEGLLLMTDDGALAHSLLSPKRHVDKVYYARAEGKLDEADCAAFAAGLELEDGLHCLPAQAGDPFLRRAERGAGDAAGGEIPSGEADAGQPRRAGDLFEAPFHGAAAAG